MGSSLLQPSFTGGELAPALYGRVDLARYGTSVRTMRNFIAQLYGGAANRPGFQFVEWTKDSTKKSRLIPFQFSTEQNYLIEMGHHYFRFYKDGARIEDPPGTPVEVTTTYAEADIFDVKFTQSADVITFTHPAYKPMQLSRTSHVDWTWTAYNFQNGPFLDVNTDASKTINASAVTGTGIVLAGPNGTFTSLNAGRLLYLEDARAQDVKPWVAGQIGIAVGDLRRSDGKVYQCTAVPPADGTKGHRTGGNRPVHDEGEAWDGDTSAEATGAYTEGCKWLYLHAGYGIVQVTSGGGTGASAFATVLSRLPESIISSNTYKWAWCAWGGDQGWPSCATYHQERQVFAGGQARPDAYWMTKTGNYTDFGVSSPTQDDDAISKTIPGRQVNAVRHVLPLDKLMFLTSGAEFIESLGTEDIVAPRTFNVKAQSFNGAAHVPPIVVGSMVLYLQEKGSVVRDIGYQYESDKYTGQDLTTLSAHLFAGKQLVDWAYTQVPWSVAWAVRSDGVLLGLTYMKDQQVAGWHRHDTDGVFESVCAISEGTEDVLYAIIKRPVAGGERRFIERLHTRQFTDVKDAFFVDAGLSYDGRDFVGTITLSGGTLWNHDEQLTATLAGAFVSLDSTKIGDAFFAHDPVDATIRHRLIIEEITSTTVCKVRPVRTVPVALRGTFSGWDYGVRDIAGLDHIDGKTVSVLADGNVLKDLVVDGSGVVALPYPAVVIHAGLPIVSDLETLDVHVPNQETLLDKVKNIPAVRVMVQDTRGLMAGPDVDHLYEAKERTFENYDDPTAMTTGVVSYRIDSNWDKKGRIFLRQDNPLPATILAVMPDVSSGGQV